MLGTIPSYHRFPSYLSLNKSYIGDLAAVVTLIFLSHIHTHFHTHMHQNMFQTLKYLAGIGLVTFVAGNRMLRKIANAKQ